MSIGYRTGGAVVVRGSAMLGDRDLLREPVPQLRRVWGSRIGYVPQAASSSLNPSMKISRQLREALGAHDGYTSEVGAALLERVGIPRPQEALRRYPFEFSGGQQQRIAIALALAPRPDVLILDEPATGLDVTTQARINRLLGELLAESGAAALYVSHDLALLS
ncbi:MAG: ATP-binding cassette domain-containing protein, partial [Mycobacteriales bacterium]